DQELTGYLREWRWKELFWIHRARLRACMRFCLFGHALYEKALQPFVGITGRGIVLSIEPQLLALPFGEQIAVLDRLATEYIADARRFASTRELAVVPILGVPGWCAANEREAYYENQDYFRPARGGMAGDEGCTAHGAAPVTPPFRLALQSDVNTTTRFRPCDLPAYRARSAFLVSML